MSSAPPPDDEDSSSAGMSSPSSTSSSYHFPNSRSTSPTFHAPIPTQAQAPSNQQDNTTTQNSNTSAFSTPGPPVRRLTNSPPPSALSPPTPLSTLASTGLLNLKPLGTPTLTAASSSSASASAFSLGAATTTYASISDVRVQQVGSTRRRVDGDRDMNCSSPAPQRRRNLVRVDTPPLLRHAKDLVRNGEGTAVDMGQALRYATEQASSVGGLRGSNNQVMLNQQNTRSSSLFQFHTGINFHDLVDAAEHPPVYRTGASGALVKDRARCPLVGTPVTVNGKELALFRHRGRAFAVENACAHQGGKLNMGDIEELVPREGGGLTLQLTCPWHGYRFDLRTGKGLNDKNLQQPVYETQLAADGQVMVGFDTIGMTNFDSDAFDEEMNDASQTSQNSMGSFGVTSFGDVSNGSWAADL